MRIAWIAPYPAQLLEPSLRLSRKVGSYHPCSWIVTLSQALSRMEGVELHLLTDSHLIPHSQTVKIGAITFHVLKTGIPFTNRRFPPYLPLDALSGFLFDVRQFNHRLREINPDLVHAHGTESSYALAGVRSGYPCLISIQGIISEIVKVSPSLRSRLVGRTERAAVLANHRFVCRTDYDSGFVRSLNPHAQIHFIHEAMNRVFFENEWRVNDSPDVLYVGHLVKSKGVEVLLKALAGVKKRAPQVRLRLAGACSETYLRHLKHLAQQLDIARNIEFLGFLSPNQVAKLHLQTQLFVLPSENENSPNTLAEAMVSGLPVIATAVGGIPSMVQQGQTGLLFERNNSQQLVEAMTKLLTNPDERRRLGANARNVARARHRPEIVAEQTLRAYRDILNTQKG